MEKKVSVLLLSLAMIASFFFPLFEWNSFEMNGLNYILSDHTPGCKYLLLLVPFNSVLIFLTVYFNGNDVFVARFISWTPLLVLILVFVLNSVKEGFIQLLPNVDIGFWMTFIFSLLLAFVLDKRKSAPPHDISFARMGLKV